MKALKPFGQEMVRAWGFFWFGGFLVGWGVLFCFVFLLYPNK